jgi:hypothetical protein
MKDIRKKVKEAELLKKVLQIHDDMLHEEYLTLVEELQSLPNTSIRARQICIRILEIGDYFDGSGSI